MRIVIAVVLALVLVTVVRAADAPPPTVDLKANPLVQKALADQEKATQAAEEDHKKKTETLNAEREKKISAAKTACIAALRRAESVANAKGNKEEALTIKALADSLASDGAADSGLGKAASPVAVNPSKNRRAIDVLGQVDLERDVQNGKWTKDRGLVSQGIGSCTINLPLLPKGDYDLIVKYVRLSDKSGLELYLTRAGQNRGWIAAGVRTLHSNVFASPNAGRREMTKTAADYPANATNTLHTIVAQVREQGVAISMDGVRLIEDTSPVGGQLENPNIRVGTGNGPIRFEAIEIVER